MADRAGLPGTIVWKIVVSSPVLVKTCGLAVIDSVLPDVFVPYLGIISDVISQQSYALTRLQVNYLNSVIPQPVNSSAKILRLAHDDRADLELTDQPAAIPTRGERRHPIIVSSWGKTVDRKQLSQPVLFASRNWSNLKPETET
jgi:hypothetical protein